MCIAKKYEIAADNLRKRIVEDMEPGQQLPSEADLAKEFGMSVLTLRRGLDILEDEKLISRNRGRRAVVTKAKKYSAVNQGQRKNILIVSVIADTFYYEQIILLQQTLVRGGYSVTVYHMHSCGADDVCHELDEVIHTHDYDGLVILPVSKLYEQFSPVLEELTIPVLFFQSIEYIPASHIYVDQSSGAYVAMRYLHEIGCKNLLFMGYGFEGDWEREEGVKRFVKECLPGKNYHNFVVREKGTIEAGYNAMKRELSSGRKIDGILAHNDLCAIGIITAAKEFGLAVPEDIAIIGFDNISQAAETSPPLTTICQPKEQVAKEAIKFFGRTFEAPDKTIINHVMLQPFLIIRESTSGFKRKKR